MQKVDNHSGVVKNRWISLWVALNHPLVYRVILASHEAFTTVKQCSLTRKTTPSVEEQPCSAITEKVSGVCRPPLTFFSIQKSAGNSADFKSSYSASLSRPFIWNFLKEMDHKSVLVGTLFPEIVTEAPKGSYGVLGEFLLCLPRGIALVGQQEIPSGHGSVCPGP